MVSTPTAARLDGSIATAFAALCLGAVAMGISPIFVRFADVGPFTSAFWRVAGALPVLWAWAAIEARRARGRGYDVVLRAPGITGSCLWHEGFARHLAVFAA